MKIGKWIGRRAAEVKSFFSKPSWYDPDPLLKHYDEHKAEIEARPQVRLAGGVINGGVKGYLEAGETVYSGRHVAGQVRVFAVRVDGIKDPAAPTIQELENGVDITRYFNGGV